MKTKVFSAILIGLATQLSAQDAQVTIQQDPKINELVKLYTKANANSGFYQIQVGFGNYEKNA